MAAIVLDSHCVDAGTKGGCTAVTGEVSLGVEATDVSGSSASLGGTDVYAYSD